MCGVYGYAILVIVIITLQSFFQSERVPKVPALCVSSSVGPAWLVNYIPFLQMSTGILSVAVYALTWFYYLKGKQLTSGDKQTKGQFEIQRKVTKTFGMLASETVNINAVTTHKPLSTVQNSASAVFGKYLV